jgi:hypothetical protein
LITIQIHKELDFKQQTQHLDIKDRIWQKIQNRWQ